MVLPFYQGHIFDFDYGLDNLLCINNWTELIVYAHKSLFAPETARFLYCA